MNEMLCSYNEILGVEYEMEDMSYIELPGIDEYDLLGEEND